MNRLLLLSSASLVGLAIAAGCSSSNDTPAREPSGDDDSGTNPGDDTSPTGHLDASTDGASLGDGSGNGGDGGSGSGGDDGSSSDSSDEQPPVGPPVCSTTATWSAGASVISTSGDDRFGGITPDELTIVWMTPTGSGSGNVLWADRASATDAFGTPNTVASSDGLFALGSIAVSADGLRIIGVATGNASLAQLTRPARSGTFGSTPDPTDFASINNFIANDELPEQLSNPVVGHLDTSLYFALYEVGAGGTANAGGSVEVSTRSGGGQPWNGASPLTTDATELATVNGMLRYPTGIANDERTLFYWDQTTSSEKAIWRDSSVGTFSGAIDLGAKQGAAPNTACNHLYYSAAGTGGMDIFVATAQ